MSDSICRFLPAKNEDTAIKTVRFVYETECLTLSQPFVSPIYALHIVTEGRATLRIYDKEYSLERGDIFFAFPAVLHYLDASEDFKYIYISFMGSGAAQILSRCSINHENPVYKDYAFLCPMFESAIRRITNVNANMLTESVLGYTLSFFDKTEEKEQTGKSQDSAFKAIVNYVDHHYRESDMSLGRLADTFSYTEKYLSSLFKKNMQIGFVNYLNNLRIQYANELIEKGAESISEIAAACGYSDYSYFARVFKKRTGKTPTQSMRFLDKK